MSTLYLIRHGQASFGAADYDVLTPLGEEQARRLGRHLAALPRFDALFTGPAKRHRDTTAHAVDAARAEGASLPEPVTLDELDEFPGVQLWRRALPALAQSDPELGALLAGGAPEAGPEARERALARATERMVDLWVAGHLDHHGVERFEDFDARVCRALDHIAETCGRGVRVAAITSGGPIGIAMRRALDLSVARTMAVIRAVVNASLSEFRYRSQDFGLFGFNATPHLDSPGLVTRR